MIQEARENHMTQLNQHTTIDSILSCEDSYEAFLLARDKLKGPVTAKDVITVACKHPRAAWAMAIKVKFGDVTPADVAACPDRQVAYTLASKAREVTAADVFACPHEEVAMQLAFRMRYVALEDVIACPHDSAASYWAKWHVRDEVLAKHVIAAKTSGAALHLAYRVPYGTVTIEDVLACKHPTAAIVLFERVFGVRTIATHKGHRLLAAGKGEMRRYAEAENAGPWTAEEAISYWRENGGERADLFRAAVEKDLSDAKK